MYEINSFVAQYVGVPITRKQIMRLENALIEAKKAAGENFEIGNTDKECPVTHHFAPGMYAREMFIPAGTVLVGKIHRFAHVNTVAKGRIIVATEEGLKEVAAPAVFVSPPETKRAGYAIEDTVWITYHPTEETDLEKIEQAVILPGFEQEKLT